MTKLPKEKDSSLTSLLAGFEVQMECSGFKTLSTDVECNMTEAEVAVAFAGIQKVSIESMKSICDSLI